MTTAPVSDNAAPDLGVVVRGRPSGMRRLATRAVAGGGALLVAAMATVLPGSGTAAAATPLRMGPTTSGMSNTSSVDPYEHQDCGRMSLKPGSDVKTNYYPPAPGHSFKERRSVVDIYAPDPLYAQVPPSVSNEGSTPVLATPTGGGHFTVNLPVQEANCLSIGISQG